MSQEVFQPLSEQQQADYSRAEALAWSANLAFDNRTKAASSLASHVHEDGFIIPSDLVAGLETALTESDEKFRYYRIGAEALMPYSSAFYNTPASEGTTEATEPSTSETTLNAMSHEQTIRAVRLQEKIAAGPLKEYGVTEDSLRVVMTEADCHKKFTLVHTGPGVDIGNPKKDYDKKRSYNSVMSDKNDALFQFEMDGITYDTRTGMTDEVYTAKVEEARARGVTLPDSQQLSQETGDDWTWTMLAGEPLTAVGLVRIRLVSEGRVGRGIGLPPGRGDRSLRVCPAVEIK